MYQNTIDTDNAFLMWTDVAVWVLNDQITNDGEKITYDYRMINDLKCFPGCHSYKQLSSSYFYGHKKSFSINSEEGVYEQSTEDCKVSVNKTPTDHMLYVMVS